METQNLTLRDFWFVKFHVVDIIGVSELADQQTHPRMWKVKYCAFFYKLNPSLRLFARIMLVLDHHDM
jgi:hypothetical protein